MTEWCKIVHHDIGNILVYQDSLLDNKRVYVVISWFYEGKQHKWVSRAHPVIVQRWWELIFTDDYVRSVVDGDIYRKQIGIDAD